MGRYLITGSSGFLGTILTRELDKMKHDLVLVDNMLPNISQVDNRFIQCDLSRPESVQKLADNGPYDAIFHLASQIDFHVGSQSDLYSNNVATAEVVAELAVQTSCKKVVFTSSNAIFLGYPGDRAIIQSDPPKPIDEYGRSKVKSEEIFAGKAESFDSIIFRCPNILDAGRVGMLSIFFDFVLEGRRCWLIGKGDSRHQCIYSGDLIDAMLKSLEIDGSHTFNIGSDNVPTISGMYEAVIAHAGTSARVGHLPAFPAIPALKLLNRLHLSPIGPYQFRMLTADFYYDCSHLKTTLSWAPTLDNGEMLCRAFDYYRENKDSLDSTKSANSGRASQGIIGILRRFS